LFTAENGNTLFFPSAGYYDSSIHYFAGKYGYVWSASRKPYYLDSAFYLDFYSDGVSVGDYYRYNGLPVHGIRNSISNQ